MFPLSCRDQKSIGVRYPAEDGALGLDHLKTDPLELREVGRDAVAEHHEGSTFNYRKDGGSYVVEWNISPVRDADGAIVAYISIQRDITVRFVAEQALEEARRQRARADERYRRSMDNAAVGMCLATPGGRITDVNEALCHFFGYDAESLTQKTFQELTAPEYLEADLENANDVLAGRIDSFRMIKQYIHADGDLIWGDLSVSCLRDEHGQVEKFIGQIIDITAAVEANERIHIGLLAADEARRQQARADERFRRSMQYAAIGMCLLAPDGRLEEVNDALCELFGYDAETLVQKNWQELTAPEYRGSGLQDMKDVLEGRMDSYRRVKEYLHADGHRVWGDLSVSCIRDENGQVENFIAQITDITARVEAEERNRVLAQQLQRQTDLMKSELDSAAAYMASIMPGGLQGPVSVSSRYLPSRELGGDSFDYRWIDDDHLLVYLIDVSGHGLGPALLSVSLHNMLRSGSFAAESLLAPEAVLAELNRRFQMDQHGYHYFTIWYGVYEASTRTLRYASAGAPPALAFNSATGTSTEEVELSTTAAPVAMFEDAVFTSRSYSVPAGCRVLVYSDGASEITLADGQQLKWAGFKNLTSRLAASSDWSIDDLIDELRALTPSGAFEDDFSLIQLTFD